MTTRTLHIDELLNNAGAAFEPAVPAFMWDSIEATLDKRDRKGGLVWWKAAAIVAVLSGVGVAGWYLSQNKAEMPASVNIVSDNTAAQPDALSGKQDGSGANTITPGTDAAGAEKTNEKSAVSIQQHRNASGYKTAAPDKSQKPEQIVIENEFVNREFNLNHFGIRAESSALPLLDASGKLRNLISPPEEVLGARMLLGIELGQAVSSTGFTVNPKFGNYVHKNFASRMAEGEGILSALSFSGQLAYRVAGAHYIFAGANYYQRRNSLNFDFRDEAPALNSVGNVERDVFGNYPIKGYISAGSGIDVKFTGTNTITAVDFPLGWMSQLKVAKGITLIPSASVNLGLISVNSNNATLNYQLLEVEKVNSDWYRKGYTLLNTSAGLYKDFGMRLKWGVNLNAGYTLSQMYIPDSPVRPRAFTGGLSTRLIWRLD